MPVTKQSQLAAQIPPILFGGLPRTPAPEVFANARRNNPVEFQILEQAYAQFAQRPDAAGLYADPTGSGATLEQIWRVFTLFGVETWCVLVRPMPADQIAGIGRLARSSPAQLIENLRRLQKLSGTLNVTTLHYDGATGHCVRLKHYDEVRDRFIYHDPWPEKALLCLENNIAGVDAQPDGGSWSVTADELERVLFASFLFNDQQARIEGVAFDILYDTWKAGDFYSFFHLHLVQQHSQGDRHRQLFHAGPFQDAVTLIVDFEDAGQITDVALILAKPWMVDNLPMAVDIGSSFVREFVPAPDRAPYDDIGNVLRNTLREPRLLQALRSAGESGPLPAAVGRQAADVVMAFVSASPEAHVASDFATLDVCTMHDDSALLELKFHLL
ncbi:MAG: hypothetical protein JWQ90_974 [Hydrocarboniphaga sp.]|uniref:hypothetical protein n=1 Tax=Hydrocarboniphaga sp. TaxID=2033016 RepID=UPI0026399D0D|nr:hypothetical protein [Hydrocarboniphaga sp.]MDB5968524.1 hypothetical protein [Hydrocarboniphaga sp.]